MLSKGQITRLQKISELPKDQQEAEMKEFLSGLTPEQIDYLRKQQRCLFCSIANNQLESFIVYEDKDNIAVLDINPASLGHLLVIPKKHKQFSWDVDDKFDNLVKRLSFLVLNIVKAPGVNIIANNGAAAGQVINHLAVHIIPRFKEDEIEIRWNNKKVSKKDLEDMRNLLVSNLKTGRKLLDKISSKQPFKKSLTKKDGEDTVKIGEKTPKRENKIRVDITEDDVSYYDEQRIP